MSTDGQSVAAQVDQLTGAGAEKIFRAKVSGAVTHRQQLKRVLDALSEGDVLLVTRLDRLARSTRDLLNMLALIAKKNAGFRSLGDAWADTTTPHGRLMLTVLAGLAEFELTPHQRKEARARRERGETLMDIAAATTSLTPPYRGYPPGPIPARGSCGHKQTAASAICRETQVTASGYLPPPVIQDGYHDR